LKQLFQISSICLDLRVWLQCVHASPQTAETNFFFTAQGGIFLEKWPLATFKYETKGGQKETKNNFPISNR